MTHLYIFGDSIAQGAWDSFGGWVQRVRAKLDKYYFDNPEKYCLTYNMGISGHSTQDVLSRFDNEMSARHVSEEDDIIIFAVGLNDTMINCQTGVSCVGMDDFEKNIHTLIQQARSYTKKICFVGLTPVNESEVNPLPWAKESAFWNNVIYQYNDCLKHICADESVKFINLLEEWQEQNYADWLFDGLHPNSIGHQKIAEKVIKQFLKTCGWSFDAADERGYIGLN